MTSVTTSSNYAGASTDVLRAIARTPPRMALFGDSITAQNMRTLIAGLSISVTSNVATMTLTAHGMPVGTSIRVCKTTNTAINALGFVTVASYVDANTVTFAAPGVADTGGSPATGGSVNCMHIKPNNGFFNAVQAKMGQKFVEVYNGAISGDRTDQALARIAEVTTLTACDSVFLMIGTNDALNSITLAVATANLRLMMDAIIASNKLLHIATIPPISTNATLSGGRTLAQAAAFILQYNAYIKKQAALDARITVHDYYSVLVDSTVTTGFALAGYTRPDDGTHLTFRGCTACANLSAAIFTSVPALARVNSAADNYVTDSSNTQLVANPLFINTGAGSAGAGITGTIATNWAASRTGTAAAVGSLVARSDGFGNNQVLTVSSAAADERIILDSEALAARVTTGDVVYFEFDITVDNAAGIKSFQPCLAVTISGVSFQWRGEVDAIGSAVNNPAPTGALTKTIKCNSFTVPAGLTALSLRIDTVCSGTVAPVITIGIPEVRKVV